MIKRVWLFLVVVVSFGLSPWAVADEDAAGLLFWSTHTDWVASEMEVLTPFVKASPFSKFEFIDRLSPKNISTLQDIKGAVERGLARLRSKNLVIYINSHGVNGFIEASDTGGVDRLFRNQDVLGGILAGVLASKGKDLNLFLVTDYCYPRSIQPELTKWVGSFGATDGSSPIKSVRVFFPGSSYQTIDSDQNPRIMAALQAQSKLSKRRSDLFSSRLKEFIASFSELAKPYDGMVWQWERVNESPSLVRGFDLEPRAQVLELSIKAEFAQKDAPIAQGLDRLKKALQAMGHLGLEAAGHAPVMVEVLRSFPDRHVKVVAANALGQMLRGDISEMDALHALDVACSSHHVKTACKSLVRIVYRDLSRAEVLRSWLGGKETLQNLDEARKALVLE